MSINIHIMVTPLELVKPAIRIANKHFKKYLDTKQKEDVYKENIFIPLVSELYGESIMGSGRRSELFSLLKKTEDEIRNLKGVQELKAEIEI